MTFTNLFGAPPSELAATAAEARQFSPLCPGAETLERRCPARCKTSPCWRRPERSSAAMTLALALRALAPGAPLLVMAPKDKGGGRLAKELAELGCALRRDRQAPSSHLRGRRDRRRRRHRRGAGSRRAALFLQSLGLWTQPGVFAWDRIDPGSALLLRHLPEFSGRGADFGCGIGILAHKILRSPKVTHLALVDIDRRAIELCRRNVATNARVTLCWADARALAGLGPLDFIAMNPPFHEGGAESRRSGSTSSTRRRRRCAKAEPAGWWPIATCPMRPRWRAISAKFAWWRRKSATRSSKRENERGAETPCGWTGCWPISAMARDAKCRCWRATDASNSTARPCAISSSARR